VQLALAEAEKKRLRLDSSVAADVPGLVSGDELRTRQVLLDLLFYAIKLTPEGTARLDVTVFDKADKTVTLNFAVTMSRVVTFTEEAGFLKSSVPVDSSSAAPDDRFVLSLENCRKLIELMQGKSGLEHADKAATFWVRIPFGVES
jgi:hypothetical protein